MRRARRRASTAVSGSSSRSATDAPGRGRAAAGGPSATSAARECRLVGRPPTTATVRPAARSRRRRRRGRPAATVGEHLLDAQRRRQPAGRARVVTGEQHRSRPSSRRPRSGLRRARAERVVTSSTARATPSHDTATAVAPAAWTVVDGVGQLGGQRDAVLGEQGDAADQRRVREDARLVAGADVQLGDDAAHPEPGVAVELRDAGQLAEPVPRGVRDHRADRVAPGGAAGLPAADATAPAMRWKAWDEADGDVKWDSPWGPGRPGWHIECSAMSMALLGDQIDIHCGGVDNIFPHHEAEIAQSEGVTGKKFVRYWLHCAHLLVDGQKMAKSLGNFYTVPDVLAKGYTGRELRYALLRVHYRVPLNFTWEGMNEARESLARIDEWLARLREVAKPGTSNTHTQRPTSDHCF